MSWMPCGHPDCDKCYRPEPGEYVDDGGHPDCEYRGVKTDICTGCGFEEQLIGDYCIECYFEDKE